MAFTILNFYGQFTASKAGKTGLTPTPAVYSVTRANPPVKAVVSVSGVTVTEIGGGVYAFGMAGLDPTSYDYIATLTTADSTVDLQTIPALQSATPADVQTVKGYAATTPSGSVYFSQVAFPTAWDWAKVGNQMDLVNAPNATALSAIASRVEYQIVDETDSQQVLTAIVNKINASGLSQNAIIGGVVSGVQGLFQFTAAGNVKADATTFDNGKRWALKQAGTIRTDASGNVKAVTDQGAGLPAKTDVKDIRGPGASVCTVALNGANGTPISDADVWISSDASGREVVAGTLQSNSQGLVTFLLDAGVTYYLWAQKGGKNAIKGAAWVAEAD